MVDDPPQPAVSKSPPCFCLDGLQLWARVDPCDSVTLPPPCPDLRGCAAGRIGRAPPPPARCPSPISPVACWAFSVPNSDGEGETRPNILPSSTCLLVQHSRGRLTHHELPTWTVHVLMWCVCRSLGAHSRRQAQVAPPARWSVHHCPYVTQRRRPVDWKPRATVQRHAIIPVPFLRHDQMRFHVLGTMFQFPRVRQQLVSDISPHRTNVMCLLSMLVPIFLQRNAAYC